MKHFFINLSLLIVSITFVACGGGDSTSTTSSTIETDNTVAVVDDITTTEPILKKGYLVDSPIAGVSYSCGGIIGTTTATGEFRCAVTPVIFSIGGLELGTIDTFVEGSVIYPQDLVGVARDNFTNNRLINLTRLLQSLDDDGNIEDAITIPTDMAERFGTDATGATLEELANMAGVELVDEESAMEHLRSNVLGGSDGDGATPPPSEEGSSGGTSSGGSSGGGGTTTPTNHTPIAYDINSSTDENQSIMIELNATDSDGDSLSYYITRTPSRGSIIINRDVVIYHPIGGFYGTDSFSYRVFDGMEYSNEANITIYLNCLQTTPTTEMEKRYSTGTHQNNDFGGSVAIYGDTIVAGAKNMSGVSGRGEVFVYKWNTSTSSWNETKLLQPTGSNLFGYSMDISTIGGRDPIIIYSSTHQDNELPYQIDEIIAGVEGEKIVAIGDPSRDYNSVRDSGAVYLYEHNSTDDSWYLSATVVPNNIVEYANFGSSVAIYHNRIVVGAPYNRTDESKERVYIFENNGTDWVQKAEFQAISAYNNSTYGVPRFGHQVDILGDYAVVSARETNDIGGFEAGVVYLYKYNGTEWLTQKVFTPQDMNVTADRGAGYFGQDVILGNGVLAITALDKQNISGVAYEGVVYLYDLETNTILQTLTPSDESSGKEFGNSIDINTKNNDIIIGAYKDISGTGSAYIFDYNSTTNSWEESIKLQGHSAGDKFGVSVGLSCGKAVVGANLVDGSTLDEGAIHIYD